MKPTANTRKGTGRRGRPENLKPWKPGQSGNPKGAPKRGESWAEVFKKIGDMTPAEAVAYCQTVAGQLSKITEPVSLKEAVVLRVYTALLFEPEAKLLNAAMDRAEGKVAQTVVTGTWREYLESKGLDASAIFERMVQTVAAELGRPDGGRGDSGGAASARTEQADSVQKQAA